MSSAIKTPAFQAKAGNIQNEDGSSIYSNGDWSLKNSTAVASVTIKDDGSVGIGTANPSYKLDVASGYARIGRGIGYNASASVGLDLGATNADSVNNSATYAWGQEVTGDANGQSLLFKRYRRANTTVEALRLDGSGTVTLGGSTATVTHQIRGGSASPYLPVARFYNNTGTDAAIELSSAVGTVTIGTANGNYQLYCNGVSGRIASGGSTVYVTSGHRFGTSTSIREAKINIQPLESTIGWLKQLKPHVYQYRKQLDGRYTDEAEEFVNTGLIYDEVVQVNPQLCFETEDGKPSGVEYTRLITPMLKAIQEQQEIIEKLEARLAALEAK